MMDGVEKTMEKQKRLRIYVHMILLLSVTCLCGCQQLNAQMLEVEKHMVITKNQTPRPGSEEDIGQTNQEELKSEDTKQDSSTKQDDSTEDNIEQTNSDSTKPTSGIKDLITVPTKEPKPSYQEVTLLAVGDNLIHTEVILSGKQSDGTYVYDALYDNLREQIEESDIAVINQETILGGTAFKYSGYPTFNSPTEIGDAVVNAGFDVVLHATNHSMDKGEKGIRKTLEFWKRYPDITVIGMYESEEEQSKIAVIEKNGIRIAMLNYTYGLNGFKLPSGKPYLVNLINKDRIKKDISRAKEISDFVIVFPHWGTEYVYEPTSYQKDLAQFMADAGADLIIGAHPHVIEPVEFIKSQNHETLVYYSLGNFISYQRKAPRMLGAMAEVTIRKDANGTSISSASVTPVVTHYIKQNGYHVSVMLLENYTEELAMSHGVRAFESNSKFTLAFLQEISTNVLGGASKVTIRSSSME